LGLRNDETLDDRDGIGIRDTYRCITLTPFPTSRAGEKSLSPLTQNDAVRIALINNRALQKTYESIGISHSELIQAGLINNPLLGYSLGRGGGLSVATLGIEIPFLDLL
jgi:hypothetical protein